MLPSVCLLSSFFLFRMVWGGNYTLVGYEVPRSIAVEFGEAHPQRYLNYLFNLQVSTILFNVIVLFE
jgi:hypothetical protein